MNPIIHDVSKSELMHMREEGMSNAEIAESLDVSYATVYRIIGKQPEGVRKPRVRSSSVAAGVRVAEAPAKPVNSSDACLVVGDRVVRVEGMFSRYEISTKDSRISIDGHMDVKFDELEAFIAELSAIQRKLPSLKIQNEMW